MLISKPQDLWQLQPKGYPNHPKISRQTRKLGILRLLVAFSQNQTYRWSSFCRSLWYN